jgi:hypothetical protein
MNAQETERSAHSDFHCDDVPEVNDEADAGSEIVTHKAASAAASENILDMIESRVGDPQTASPLHG